MKTDEPVDFTRAAGISGQVALSATAASAEACTPDADHGGPNTCPGAIIVRGQATLRAAQSP